MVQHANGIDEIEAFRRKWQMMQIGLDDVDVLKFGGVAMCDFDGGSKINCPHLRSIARHVKGMASGAAARVQHALAAKALRRVRREVVLKVLLPLGAHFGKVVPFVTEAVG